MGRTLVKDPNTGMMVSVPSEKMEEYSRKSKENRELSPEAKAKFDRAWEKAMRKVYGK
jgi:hypothetical protein